MSRALALAIVLIAIVLAPLATAEEPARFSGPVGQFAEAADFVNFVFDHQKETVIVDVDFAEEEFAGSLGEPGETVSFVLWEECEDLPEEEPPGTSWCTGTEINIEPGEADATEPEAADPSGEGDEAPETPGLSLWAGEYRLKGTFQTEGCDGPHQGLMGCTLTLLGPAEAAGDGCPCDNP